MGIEAVPDTVGIQALVKQAMRTGNEARRASAELVERAPKWRLAVLEPINE